MTFTDAQREYLRTQHLGRLATIGPRGAPQNRPVTFFVDAQDRIVVGGHSMGSTQKFKNAAERPQVAFVVDDLVSASPWTVRALEVRGQAETLTDVEPPAQGFSREVIRITPARVLAFGIE